jgi:hypothetical protein
LLSKASERWWDKKGIAAKMSQTNVLAAANPARAWA